MWIWRVEPSPSRSPRTISTLIFTRQLGISLANASIHDVFLPQSRSKMFKMDASVANLKGKICGSDDIPLGCLIVRCVFIIEIIRVWCSWLVRQIKTQLIHLLSTENCPFWLWITVKAPKIIFAWDRPANGDESPPAFHVEVLSSSCMPRSSNGCIFETALGHDLPDLHSAMETLK